MKSCVGVSVEKNKLVYFQTTKEYSIIISNIGVLSNCWVTSGECIRSYNNISSDKILNRDYLLSATSSSLLSNMNIEYLYNVVRTECSKFNNTIYSLKLYFLIKDEYVNITNIDLESSDVRNSMHCRLIAVINRKTVYRDIDGLRLLSLDDDQIHNYIDQLIGNLIISVNNVSNSMNNSVIKRMDVIFSPSTAGYFVHETIGHLLEGDMVVKGNSIIGKNCKIGELLSHNCLNVVDQVEGYERYVGLNRIDDEGTLLTSIPLVTKGELTNYICDNETSKLLGVSTCYGNARCENFKKVILPRMRATIISNNHGGGDLISHIRKSKESLLINNIVNGCVDSNTGTYQLYCDLASVIRNGEVLTNVTGITITGNIFDALKHIDSIGDDMSVIPSYCIKRSQKVSVCLGSPTLLVRDVQVMGGLM
jgi:predicted Zn-dependent protease